MSLNYCRISTTVLVKKNIRFLSFSLNLSDFSAALMPLSGSATITLSHPHSLPLPLTLSLTPTPTFPHIVATHINTSSAIGMYSSCLLCFSKKSLLHCHPPTPSPSVMLVLALPLSHSQPTLNPSELYAHNATPNTPVWDSEQWGLVRLASLPPWLTPVFPLLAFGRTLGIFTPAPPTPSFASSPGLQFFTSDPFADEDSSISSNTSEHEHERGLSPSASIACADWSIRSPGTGSTLFSVPVIFFPVAALCGTLHN